MRYSLGAKIEDSFCVKSGREFRMYLYSPLLPLCFPVVFSFGFLLCKVKGYPFVRPTTSQIISCSIQPFNDKYLWKPTPEMESTISHASIQ